MKRKILCVVLAAILCFACVLPAEAAFVDTAGHWAEAYINRAVGLGLFSGITSTEFRPNAPMTRAMVVTVLGRLAKISTDEWSQYTWFLPYRFKDVKTSSYYAPYLAWAALHGITSGTSSTAFSPSMEITREQLATMFHNFLKMEGYTLRTTGSTPSFTDASQISSWAKESVTYLAKAGVIKGFPGSSGGVYFAPKRNATRAECATMFCRLIDVMRRSFTPSYATKIALSSSSLNLSVGQTKTLTATITPSSATNKTVVWFSSNSAVAKVSTSGKITALKAGTAKIYALSNKKSTYCSVTVTGSSNLASASMTYREKCLFVYGFYVDGENTGAFRDVYKTQEEALSHQSSITVPVWTVVNGSKVGGTKTFQIHTKLAATVKQIFQEIYNAGEQPPMFAIGGWRWRSYESSEHNMGTALDLNPSSNPYVYSGSNAYDEGFKPGEDPYSIPIGGTVDKIFQKYGFKRGIYWNSGNKDYMHYSFFGW